MIQRMLLNETSYFGPGAIEKIPDEVREHCWEKALIVTDRDLIRLGVAARVTHILDENKIKYSLFDDIHQNPSDACIVGRNIRPVLSGMFRHAEQVVEDELAGATLADCMARMRERIDNDEKDLRQPDNRQQEGNRK